jgi:hypothetical protein
MLRTLHGVFLCVFILEVLGLTVDHNGPEQGRSKDFRGPVYYFNFFLKKTRPFIHKLLPTQNLLSNYILKSIKILKIRKITNFEKREK